MTTEAWRYPAVQSGFAEILDKGGLTGGTPLPFGPHGLYLNVTGADGRRGSIIVSQSDHPDNPGEWLHASIAFPDSDPTYVDLVLLHRAVFGRRRFAYQVFAPTDRHVNIHEHALHLWGRVDGANVLPDFGLGGTI